MSGTKDIKHDGHRDRMRERILSGGLETLQPHEVLEYVLFAFIPRKNTNDIAHALIEEFGSLSNVLNADISHLEKVKGMTHNAAVFIHELPSLFRIYSNDIVRERANVSGRGTARDFLRVELYGKPIEQVYAVALDAHDKVLQMKRFSSGSGDNVGFSVRDVADFALSTHAVSIILAHNHPSGSSSPSSADIKVTREIAWTLTSLGVRLQDHYIFAGTDNFSFEEKGLISTIEKEKQSTLDDGMVFYYER
ncbi:MAG: hypothetical protein MJ193_00855 [Clostridia bacterium]|nr:hypothetical protein [Clostridia bacterium]